MRVGRGEAVAGDAGRGCRATGESVGCWLHLPVSACPSPPPNPHLARTISKPLAQALLPSSDVQPHSLTSDTTLVFHAKPPGRPGSLLLGTRCFMGTAGCPLAPKTRCFALSLLPWQGWWLWPEPPSAPWAGSSPHPSCHPRSLSSAGCYKPSWGGRERREWESRDPPPVRESGEGGGCLWAAIPCGTEWGVWVGSLRRMQGAGEATRLPSAPTGSRGGCEAGGGWHILCHCPGSWRGPVCRGRAGMCGGVALPRSARRGVRAVTGGERGRGLSRRNSWVRRKVPALLKLIITCCRERSPALPVKVGSLK